MGNVQIKKKGLVRLVQFMYKNVRSRVRVGDGYREEFGDEAL